MMGIKSSIAHIGGKGISANADANLMNRLFSQEGMGGAKQFKSAKGRFSSYNDERKLVNEQISQHRDQIRDMNRGLEGQTSDTVKASVKESINQQTAAIRNLDKNRKHSLTGASWGATKDVFEGMNSGSAGQVAAKWGAAAGGFMLLNGTGRALTGGGTTYNATGERDIMGIPFV